MVNRIGDFGRPMNDAKPGKRNNKRSLFDLISNLLGFNFLAQLRSLIFSYKEGSEIRESKLQICFKLMIDELLFHFMRRGMGTKSNVFNVNRI